MDEHGNELVPADDDVVDGEVVEELSEAEQAELQRLEDSIHKAHSVAWAVAGAALDVIREKRLYRGTHNSFDAYCAEEWNTSRRTADRWIRLAREEALSAPPGDKRPAQRRATSPVSPRAALSQRELEEREAIRKRGEVPGPLPTEADRIAGSSAKAKERRALPPPAPPSAKAAVAHLLDHLQDLDAGDAAPHMTAAQAEAVMGWASTVAATRGARAVAQRRRDSVQSGQGRVPSGQELAGRYSTTSDQRPKPSIVIDCPPHPVGRTIDGVCMACGGKAKR